MGKANRMTDGELRPRQTVILAAGNGARLNGSGHHHPKPLLLVAGRPLIEHALRQAEAVGCEEAVVVIGCGADRMRDELGRLATPLRLRLVFNPWFDLPNGVSLLTAEPYAAQHFFLQMADHVFARPVLELLDGGAPADGRALLLVDRSPLDLDEADATKVRIADNRITVIGKEVQPWDGFDAGCFRMDHRIFGALRGAGAAGAPTVSAGMARLAAAGELAPVTLPGVAWVDVDRPQDLERANALLGPNG